MAEQNRGVRVRRPDPAIRSLVVDLRRKIESFALSGLCRRGAEALSFFAENIALFQTACQRGEMTEVVEHYMAFHRHIVENGGGVDLAAVWMPEVTHMMLPYARHRDLMDSYREHEAMVEVLRRSDESAALECLRENIQ